jgi:hypothetical protein
MEATGVWMLRRVLPCTAAQTTMLGAVRRLTADDFCFHKLLSFIYSSEKFSDAWQKIFEFVKTGTSLSPMLTGCDECVRHYG